jgi:prolyl-tRNA editing enzyme YbaK/EbsC (Cys-tRNA(Pro) deacylase)
MMMRSVDRVREAAEAAGVAIDIRTMPDTTRTAEQAAAACGVGLGQIVKSLVFRNTGSGQPVLILVSGENRVDQAAVAAQVGEALERMDAKAVREVTGFAIGGVAPFGSIRPISVLMDADLLAYDVVWAAAGAPNAVFAIAPQALADATNARIVPVR